MITRLKNLIHRLITLDGRLLGLDLTLGERYKATVFVGRNDGHSLTFSVLVTGGAWATPMRSGVGGIHTYLDLELTLGVISFALSLYRTSQSK